MPRLLITGVTGLIGRSVLKTILDEKLDFQISAMMRPGTVQERYSAFRSELEIVKIDLSDITNLKRYLEDNVFDVIVHIGALRGGRRATRQDFVLTNISSTEQFAEHCLRHGGKLIYCSSVGVFGVIPEELPANNQTEYNPDNLYHYTKIECEKLIDRAVLNGLNAVILRPSITYGKGDKGFPYQMVNLIGHNRFPLVNKKIWIHLCHIDTITKAFLWAIKNVTKPGLSLNVADREAVQLQELVNFISRQLSGKNYLKLYTVDRRLFRWGEKLAGLMKNDLWLSRFQLISRSWFYYVSDTYQLMGLPETFTIPGFQVTIEDYQASRGNSNH